MTDLNDLNPHEQLRQMWELVQSLKADYSGVRGKLHECIIEYQHMEKQNAELWAELRRLRSELHEIKYKGNAE